MRVENVMRCQVRLVDESDYECSPYDVEEGDVVVATYDGNREIGEVEVNPTKERVVDMQERVMEMSQIMAEAAAEDNEDTPENWKDYIADGYPRIEFYKVEGRELVEKRWKALKFD